MIVNQIKRWLIGSPLRTRQLSHEKLPKWKALAIFSSDALSSVAYATEEILLILAIIGLSAFVYSIPIAIAILVLLLMVTLSYRQIVHSFPSGGGAYVVARENLNTSSSLVAGAALMIDYILTVAVSISSGVAALLSAFPSLITWKVEIAVILVLVLMVLNLRGIRESATLFAYPTYLFIISILVMVIVGGIRLWQEGWTAYEPSNTKQTMDILTGSVGFLLLRAFASGCSALTGIEAISNGVPAFRSPSARNAGITMVWMSVLLGMMFFGITLLAYAFGIAPQLHETVVSQIAEHVFGRGILYYILQLATVLILILAANTSFTGFPQLASIIAQDKFLPRSLAIRGDRLVFSNGIVMLSLFAILLIIIFKGDTHSLIPLYAVGVFLSFTIAQWGMVRSFFKKHSKRPWLQIFVTGLGTLITGIVTLITVIAKFTEGAWMVALAIPIIVWMFYKVRNHYNDISEELHLDLDQKPFAKKTKVIIPISGVSKVVAQSISYAKGISDDIVVVTVEIDDIQAGKIREKWEHWNPEVELIILRSPYRTLSVPLLKYIDSLEKKEPGHLITVLIPQFIVKKWWHALLHNQTALILRTLILFRKDVVVSTIPFHLHH
jgi:amino acid transporter